MTGERTGVLDKIFRDNQGHIAIVQMPNALLWTWIAASIIKHFLHDGNAKRGVGYLAFIALVVWALLEVWKGDSLFRRILGGVVLLAMILSRFR